MDLSFGVSNQGIASRLIDPGFRTLPVKESRHPDMLAAFLRFQSSGNCFLSDISHIPATIRVVHHLSVWIPA
jgi:hypothetical protein